MPLTLTETATRGTPLIVPEDGVDFRKAETVQVPFQAVANRLKFLEQFVEADGDVSGIGHVTLSGEIHYTSAPTRKQSYEPDLIADPSSVLNHGTNQDQLATNSGGYFRTIVVPTGATLTGVRVMMQPGVPRPTGADRVAILLRYFALNWGAPSKTQTGTSSVVQDDGTAGIQVLAITGLSIPGDRDGDTATTLRLEIKAGADAATNPDSIYAIRPEWADPGPRNY